MKLVGGGSVINRAYPVYFFWFTQVIYCMFAFARDVAQHDHPSFLSLLWAHFIGFNTLRSEQATQNVFHPHLVGVLVCYIHVFFAPLICRDSLEKKSCNRIHKKHGNPVILSKTINDLLQYIYLIWILFKTMFFFYLRCLSVPWPILQCLDVILAGDGGQLNNLWISGRR